MKNNLNLDNLTRDELAHYIVSHRNMPQSVEARRVFIQRMAEKAKNYGIELDQSGIPSKPLLTKNMNKVTEKEVKDSDKC